LKDRIIKLLLQPETDQEHRPIPTPNENKMTNEVEAEEKTAVTFEFTHRAEPVGKTVKRNY